MTPDEHIAYWRKAAANARTKESALTAFGVYAGLSMMEGQCVNALRRRCTFS